MVILRSQPTFLAIILIITNLNIPQAFCGIKNAKPSCLPCLLSLLEISPVSKNAVMLPQRRLTPNQPPKRYLNTLVQRPHSKISNKITDTLLSTRKDIFRQKADIPIANPEAETRRLFRGAGAVAHTFFRTMAVTGGATSGLIAVGLGMGWLGISKERNVSITLPKVSLPSYSSEENDDYEYHDLAIHGGTTDDLPYIKETMGAIKHQPPKHITKQLLRDMKEQYLTSDQYFNPLIDKLAKKQTTSNYSALKNPSFPLQGIWNIPPVLHIPAHLVSIEHSGNKYHISLDFNDWYRSAYTLGTLYPDPDNAHQAWGVLPRYSDFANYSTFHLYYVFVQIKTDKSGKESLCIEYYNKDGTQAAYYVWPREK